MRQIIDIGICTILWHAVIQRMCVYICDGDVNSYIPSSYKPETLLENTKYRNHKYHHLKSVIALLIKYGAKQFNDSLVFCLTLAN